MTEASPGPDGTCIGSCVACRWPADTGLVFEGEAAWVIAGLTVLSIPNDQAVALLGWQDGAPDGLVTHTFRVCEPCAARDGFPVGLITAGGCLPVVAQP